MNNVVVLGEPGLQVAGFEAVKVDYFVSEGGQASSCRVWDEQV